MTQATAIAERQDVAAPAAITPMEMLDRAVANGASVETLTQLMALQERWEANQARRAFDEAMSEAKAKIPIITKNKQVGFESRKAGAARTDYKHETLDEIARVVTPILAKHGLSYRFRTSSNANEPVTVTCIISHRDGHSEENTLSAGRDETGNKNSIQAVGSTITYLQRYTLKAALGLAAAADDDGAKSDAGELINEEQVAELRSLIMDVNADLPKLLAYLQVEKLEDIFANKLDSVKRVIEQKRAKAAS